MAGRLMAQGVLTIMDFSDAIISSTPPNNPFENMIWIDTSQNPPVHKIYKYFYDDDGNKIGEGWVEIGETLPIPPGIAFGGYLTCKITYRAGSTGGIEISSGYFSNNKVPKTVISTNCRIVTQLSSNKGRIRFIIFTNKDTDVSYKQGFGTNSAFLIATRQNGKWYYEGQGSTLVEFTPKSDYCNVGKIVEYSSSETGTGIKEIIMYAEDPESMFNLLTGEGERQGMFTTEDGKVFINGEYINARNLKVIDTNNNTTFYVNEQGEVTIRATEFSLEGKTIGDFLNEMEIGGRNFHLGSENWSNTAFTSKVGSIIEGNILTVQKGSTVNGCYINVEAGEEYTFSVDMKTTVDNYSSHTYLIQYFNNANTRLSYEWNTSQLTTSWKRISQTFTIPDNVTKVSIGYRSDSTTLVSYRYPKFEKGNKATDWTPAPEDLKNEMDEAISQQQDKINEITNDSNLTAAEKRQLQIMIEEIDGEYQNIIKSCTTYGVDYTELDVYYQDLKSYLQDGCAIYDLSITTGVDKDTMKGYFSNYYQSREMMYDLVDAARKDIIDNKLGPADSERVFKALTDNGKKQGLYMQDGNFYFNGQYINAKNLKVVDNENNTTLYIDQDGNVTIRATEFSLEGKTISSYIGDAKTELNGSIDAAKKELNQTISNVSNNIVQQKNRIDEITNDGNLTPTEKRQLQIIYQDLYQAHTTTWNIAHEYGIDLTVFDDSFTQLQSYLENECDINNLVVTTGVNKDTLKSYFDNYYTQRELVLADSEQCIQNNINNKLSVGDSTGVFNALTNQGKRQGMYIQNGQIYFNGQYVNTKNLRAVDNNNNVTFFVDENGEVTIRAKTFSLEGKTIGSYIDDAKLDMNSSMNTAVDNAKKELNETINTVKQSVSSQKDRIDKITDDGNLTPAEKRQLQIILSDLTQTNASIESNSTNFGIDCEILNSCLSQLTSYLEEVCQINDLTTITSVDKDTIKNLLDNYYAEREAVLLDLEQCTQDKIDGKISTGDSTGVFNALTNQGKRQGMYIQNGQIYFNGQYVNTKNLRAVDTNNNLTFFVDENGEVTIRAKSFSLAGKTIDDYINDIQIGGRNLLRKTSTFELDSSRKTGWVNSSNKWTVAYSEADGCHVVSNSATGLTSLNIRSFFSNFVSCKVGDTFTLSCWVKVKDVSAFDYGVTFIIDEYDDADTRLAWQDTDPAVTAGTNKVTFESDKWTYCTATYTIRKEGTTKLGIRLCIFKNGEIAFKMPKIERGNKATDWTPAPEDLQESISVTMKRVSIQYYVSTSPTELLGGSWSTAKPTWVSGKYIWQKTVTTYSNDTTAESNPVCITGPQGEQGGKGDQGVSITRVSNRYGKNTSKTTAPTSWQTSYPGWEKGYYIWTKSIVYYSNGSTTETDPYVDTSWEGMADIVDGKVDKNQQAVFNALTNNGQVQGIYLDNGKVYINGEYIKADTITGGMLQADSIDGKTISGATLKGCRIFASEDPTQTDGHKFRIYSDGRIYSNNFIQCYGATPNDGVYSELNDGYVVATEYVKSPALKTTKQNLYFAINDAAVPGTGSNTDRLRFCQIGDNKYFMPDYDATSATVGVRLGASGHMWSTVYAKGGVNTGSDRTIKENIRYLNADNANAVQSEDLTEKDLYNFVKDDLIVAEYNFKGEERTEIGFIAQDILYNLDGTDNKVGQMLVNKTDEEQSPLTYSEKTYSNILAGALRQAINKIETLENKLESLEKRIEELEKK